MNEDIQTTTKAVDVSPNLAGVGPTAGKILLVLGLGALMAGVVAGRLGGDDWRYFFHSYLVNYCFCLSIVLGSLFFVALQHVTRAGWSVSVRRIAEILAGNITVLTLLFVPLALGLRALYPWANPALVAESELLQHKAPYLNVTFFGLRCVGYLMLWFLMGRFFLSTSTAQDSSGDPALTNRMERFGGPALILLAFSGTFAAFDLLMSVEPAWFSTIFGLYFLAGAVVGALAVMILVAVALQQSGRLVGLVTVEHYHDLGKLLFSAVVFWGYMAFSQYMLIWYANIPEETEWYLSRQSGTWGLLAVVLIFGHLLIPFFGLLSRAVKRRKVLLAFWAAWLLVVHWIDIYWLVMPAYWHAADHASHAEAVQPGLAVAIDFLLFVGLACLFLAGAFRVAGNRSLVPSRDPRLDESLAFENS